MAAKKTKKRNWAKIKAEYCTTTISIRDLAKKYKIPYSTINTRALKEKWTSQKQEVLRDIDAEVDAKAIQKAKEKEIEKKVKANELHTELYDKGLEIANLIMENYIRDLHEGKKRTGATATNLDYLMSAIQKCQKGQRMSLNIEAEDTGTTEPEVTVINGLDINKI